jgi:hypothetical protein
MQILHGEHAAQLDPREVADEAPDEVRESMRSVVDDDVEAIDMSGNRPHGVTVLASATSAWIRGSSHCSCAQAVSMSQPTKAAAFSKYLLHLSSDPPFWMPISSRARLRSRYGTNNR